MVEAELRRAGRRAIWTSQMVYQASRQARFPFAAEKIILRAQERRIGRAIAYARANVPYYRETMRRAILGPEDLRTASDLARLPLLEREHLQRDPEYFLSQQWPAASCIQLQSGGTTGAPMTVFRDPASLLLEAAYRERQRSLVTRLAGRRARYREASITPLDSSVGTAIHGLRHTSLVPTGLRVQRHEISMFLPQAEIIDALDRARPDVISTYGSYLEALLAHLRHQGRRIDPVRVAVYGADRCSAEMRAWAQTELGIHVLSSYNAVEAPQIGFECEQHRGHHLNVDLCPVRLIDPAGGETVGDGPGEVVISNLVNRGTVLLNYRLGDVVTREPGSCACGRTLPLGSYLERRGTRWLDLGGGIKLHSQTMQSILRSEMGIRRYQVVQEDRRRFLLRIVPAPDCDRASLSARVEARFASEVGRGVTVRLEFVADLPRSASGKVQPVVSL